MPEMRRQNLRDRKRLYLRTLAGGQNSVQIQSEQNDSRPRHSERAGRETSYHGKNRSYRGLHFKTWPTILCLSEIGGGQNQFRVPGENRTGQLNVSNRTSAS